MFTACKNWFEKVPTPLWLMVILGLGAVLRLNGITWSLPNPSHVFSFHPDEISVVRATWNLDFTRLDFNPNFFAYGSIFFYFNHVVFLFGKVLGYLQPAQPFSIFLTDLKPAFFLTRLHSVFWSLSLIGLTFLFCKQTLQHNPTALWAAFLVSVNPLAVYQGHFATVDSAFATACFACLFLIATRIERQRWQTNFLIGLGIGLTTALKFQGILLLFPLVVTLTTQKKIRLTPLILILLVVAMGCGLGFFLGCPYALLDFHAFWREAGYEIFGPPFQGHGAVSEGIRIGSLYQLSNNLPVSFGWPLTLIFFAVVISKICRPLKRWDLVDILFLAFFFIWLLVFGASKVRYIRYVLPLVPLISIFAAQAIVVMLTRKRYAGIFLLICIFSVAYTLAYAIARSKSFSTADSRYLAAQWIEANVDYGKTIGHIYDPWFAFPPITPFNGTFSTAKHFEQWKRSSRFSFIKTGFDVDELYRSRPDYFVLSDFDFREESRIGRPDVVRFLSILNRDYSLAAPPWKTTLSAFGVPFEWGHPHIDWLYVTPTIFVYEKNEASTHR